MARRAARPDPRARRAWAGCRQGSSSAWPGHNSGARMVSQSADRQHSRTRTRVIIPSPYRRPGIGPRLRATPDQRRQSMRRALSLLLIAGLLGTALGTAGPAAAQGPVVAQFWYSFGGTNREVTEAHIKRFNESQSKYRIEGTFQGDYFQALAKIRAAAATKTAPAVFHVIGEAMPQLWQSGLFENLEPYAKGANGTNLEDFLPGQTQHTYFDYQIGRASCRERV